MCTTETKRRRAWMSATNLTQFKDEIITSALVEMLYITQRIHDMLLNDKLVARFRYSYFWTLPHPVCSQHNHTRPWTDSPLVYCLNIVPPFWMLNRNVLSGNKLAYIHLYVILKKKKMFTFIWSTCVKFKEPSAGLLTINWLELDRSEAFLCILI